MEIWALRKHVPKELQAPDIDARVQQFVPNTCTLLSERICIIPSGAFRCPGRGFHLVDSSNLGKINSIAQTTTGNCHLVSEYVDPRSSRCPRRGQFVFARCASEIGEYPDVSCPQSTASYALRSYGAFLAGAGSSEEANRSSHAE
jgi:hypothetical protein